MILALDVATTTGWACGSAGEHPQYGHFRAGKRGMKGGEIVTLFRDWLKLQCEIKKPRWLIYESPYVPRVAPPRVRTATGQLISTLSGGAPPIDINVLRRLITLCGIVEELGWRYSIEVREEASNVVCRQFTGRSRVGLAGGQESCDAKDVRHLWLARGQRRRGRRARLVGLCRSRALSRTGATPRLRPAVCRRRVMTAPSPYYRQHHQVEAPASTSAISARPGAC